MSVAVAETIIHIPNYTAQSTVELRGLGDRGAWLSSPNSIHLHLERACLPSKGSAVTAFLAKRSASPAEMGPDDQIALIEWIDRALARKPPEWERSAAIVAITSRNLHRDWITPNVWDRPEMAAWRERRSVVSAADLADLFVELESAVMEVANHG